MTKNSLEGLGEIFVSDRTLTVAVSRALAQGRLRKLASRLYTTNLVDPPEQIVRRHVWELVGKYVPGALIADRTAIENVPAEDGSIFVIAKHKRAIELPGVTIVSRKGTPPLPSDQPFVSGLFLSSTARAYVENMLPSRRRERTVSRTLSRDEVEARLETMLRRSGAQALNRLRDEARQVAEQLDQRDAFKALEQLIGALQGTRDAHLVTPQGVARQAGTPYDPDRVQLFQLLHNALLTVPPTVRMASSRTPAAHTTLAFFDAYFSNFIEGTEFAVSEAADIVFRSVIPRERPADAHDILGTWKLVSDSEEMARTPRDARDFIQILRRRHALVLDARPGARPGEFKAAVNRAGNTVFVAPELVEGTLARGFELYQGISSPLARATYMMFLVSEVHPFVDGNGRLARIMMNAELIAGGEERIVIPTVYRNNYLAALKALSQNQRAEPFIRMLDYAQKWTAQMPWGDFHKTQAVLRQCNAFVDSGEADASGLRLRLPDSF